MRYNEEAPNLQATANHWAMSCSESNHRSNGQVHHASQVAQTVGERMHAHSQGSIPGLPPNPESWKGWGTLM